MTTDYLDAQIKLDYAGGSDVNPYTGFDRFGRIIDLLWQKYASSSSSSSSGSEPPGLVHLQYTYDRASNRTSRADLIAQWYDKDFDELYEYDGMHRLKKFHRGRLVESDTVIESPTLQQGWRLDATGNWRNFTQNDQADPAQTLAQQRLSNRVNEITEIARTVGANWVTPEYDRNGNMTVIPQPKDPTLPYRGTWDAWNRLVKLEEPDDMDGWQTLQENTYDGQIWRIIRKDHEDGSLSETKHFYYTNQWQDIEERLDGETDPNIQYVWGLRYIDDLVLRDRDTDGNGSLNERRYSIQDANWNVVGMDNVVDDTLTRIAYTAYGRPSQYDSLFNLLEIDSHDSCIGYSGYICDDLTLLFLPRHRFYNSAQGNWLSRDPLFHNPQFIEFPTTQFSDQEFAFVEEFLNSYQYANSMPVSEVDPSGLRVGIGPAPPIFRPSTGGGGGIRPGSGVGPGTRPNPYAPPVRNPDPFAPPPPPPPWPEGATPMPPLLDKPGWRPAPGTPEWEKYVRDLKLQHGIKPIPPITKNPCGWRLAVMEAVQQQKNPCKLIGSGGCNKIKGTKPAKYHKRCSYTCDNIQFDKYISCIPVAYDPPCPDQP